MRRALLTILGITGLCTNPATAGFVTKPKSMSIGSQYSTGGTGSQPAISLKGQDPQTLPDTSFAPGRGTIATSVGAKTDYSESSYQPAATLEGHLSVGGFDPYVSTYSTIGLTINSTIATTLQTPTSQQEANGRIVFTSYYSISGHLAEGDILMFSVNSHAETRGSGGGIIGIMDYSPTGTWKTVRQAGDFSFTFMDTRVIPENYGWWARNNNISKTWDVSSSVAVLIYHDNGPGTTSIVIDPGVSLQNSAMVPEPATFLMGVLGCTGVAGWRRIRRRRSTDATRGDPGPA